MKVLITGNAGTGKSTVLAALSSRGYTSYDGDQLKEIHAFLDKKTGRIVAKPGPEGFARYTTIWRPNKLKPFLESQDNIFFGGSVSNWVDFCSLFDCIIGLTTPQELLAERLATRTNNSAGNNKRDRDYLLSINDRVNANLLDAGAIMISSDQPLEKLVDEVLRIYNEHR